ncbi:MAG TPA: hypothetical protein VFB60_09475 [Ktedonobacteraceae bacterium]|nr:hypothetical protein [Ktedonobacteraceae bacterium]
MMDCVHAMAPSDEELIKLALDNEPLLQEAKEHLAGCSICQRRLARYQNVDTFLVSRLYRSRCPEATKLNHYCANMLSPDEVIDITHHLELCPLCTNEVADIRKILANFDPFPTSEPLFAPQAAIRRIIASLVPWQPQLSLRSEISAQSTWPRQYRAESLNLSLHLSRSSNGEIMLLGLFTSARPDDSVDAFQGVPVKLYQASVPSLPLNGQYKEKEAFMSTEVDDLGNIAFIAVPEGEYVMIVCLQEAELVVEGLTIERD